MAKGKAKKGKARKARGPRKRAARTPSSRSVEPNPITLMTIGAANPPKNTKTEWLKRVSGFAAKGARQRLAGDIQKALATEGYVDRLIDMIRAKFGSEAGSEAEDAAQAGLEANPPRGKYPLPLELRARAIAAHNRGQMGLARQLTTMAARLEGNPHGAKRKSFYVVRVGGRESDTHADETLRGALDLAAPDAGDRVEVKRVYSDDAGFARLARGGKWRVLKNPAIAERPWYVVTREGQIYAPRTFATRALAGDWIQKHRGGNNLLAAQSDAGQRRGGFLKNPGTCPVCAGPGWGMGEICMDCVRSRAKTVANRGRCSCGKKRIPGAPAQVGSRVWTPCERCLGAIPGSQREAPRRTSKNPSGRGLVRVSRGPVRAAAHVDGFEENVEGCKRFHGVAPNRVRLFEFDDGKKEVTDQVVFALGDAEVEFNVVKDEDGNEIQIPKQRIQSVYRVRGKRSSKAGKSFVHSATEDGGRPSLKVCDATTHILSDLGDYQVDDYIRERRA